MSVIGRNTLLLNKYRCSQSSTFDNYIMLLIRCLTDICFLQHHPACGCPGTGIIIAGRLCVLRLHEHGTRIMSMINHRRSVRSVVVLALVLVIPSLACSLGGGASATEPVGVLPTGEQGTVISATSAIPTATPLPTTGVSIFTAVTLIVT